MARAADISVYDAMYVELAVRMRLPLATLDWTLAGAARAAGVEALAFEGTLGSGRRDRAAESA